MLAKKVFLYLFVTLFFCSSTSFASSNQDPINQRELFLRVEKDLRNGNKTLFKKYSSVLKSYPLYPYLEYQSLRRNIRHTTLKDLNGFLEKYPTVPLASKLRIRWLEHQAKQGNWKSYLQAYVNTENTELQCNYLWAHYKTNNRDSIFKYVPSIWLSSESQPKACDPIFAAWEKTGLMSRAMIWQRIKLAIEDRNPKLARYLSTKLDDDEKKLVELWIKVSDNPKLINRNHYFTSKHPAIAEILVYGITKVATDDPSDTVKLWQKIAKKHSFSQKHWLLVVKSIGVGLAKEQHPDADKWLAKIPVSLLNQQIVDSRLRFALKNKNWQAVLNVTENLPDDLKEDEKWLYWQARALEIFGQEKKSQEILNQLSTKRSYYGFLSSLRLFKPYSFKNTPIPIHQSDLDSTRKTPAIARAYELQKINRPYKANIEWRQALKSMSTKEKEAAAILAAQWKFPNWAIVALANSESKNDLSLRFPKSYSKYILKESKRNKLDPSLIFAITRQESAFVPTARSSAGALGLMQLMPRTGKMIAKQQKIKIRNNYDFLDEEKNILLGSKYFRMMLDKYQQNPVLAAAAYNAGPHRIMKWLPEHDMPADGWIESIPYKETRNYVQNVLTYAVIYQELLHSTPALHANMPVIPSKAKFEQSKGKS